MTQTAVGGDVISDGVDPSWAERVYDSTLQFLRKHDTFFPDDMSVIMGDDLPSDLRHTGHVIRRLIKNEHITPTGELVKVAAGTHYRPIYRSNIYRSRKRVFA